MIALEAVAAVICLFWVALSLDRTRAWPREMRLPPTAPDPGPIGASVVAVVPARNEAALLGRTLPTLLRQAELEAVVLVDDDSEDETAEIARELASEATSSRLLVIAGDREEGWAGKVRALDRGLAAAPRAEGENAWWLLTDADIEHRPGSVRSLLERARDGYDMVSVMARLRADSPWERALVPTFVYFFQILYPFRKVAAGRVAAAAGGCVLVRREALERAGGVASIRAAVIDDVALAGSVAAAGGRLWLGLDQGIRSLRRYPRLADLWRMVARSAYDQLGYRADLLIAVVLALLVFFVAPPAVAAAGAVLGVGGSATGWRIALWAGLAFALQWRSLLPVVRHHGLSAPHAAVLPVSSLLFAAMTVSSAWSHVTGRPVPWRGRRVSSPGAAGDTK